MTAEDFFLRGQALVNLGQKEYGILSWRQALGRDVNHVETLGGSREGLLPAGPAQRGGAGGRAPVTQPGWEAPRQPDARPGAGRAVRPGRRGGCSPAPRPLTRPDQWHGADTTERIVKQLARFLLRTGRPDQARDALRQLAAPADDPEACWLLSRCDLQQGTSDVATTLGPALRVSRGPSPGAGAVAIRRRGGVPEMPRDDLPGPAPQPARAAPSRRDQLRSIPLPDWPIADPANHAVSHAFARGEDRIELQTRVANRVFRTVVDYAFGSGDRGLTLVGHDGEDRPFEYRLSHYPDPVGWDVTSGQPGPVEQPERYQGSRITADAVRRCLVCHTTNARSILTGSGPESADAAIGCERRHGPGSHHLKAEAARGGRPGDRPTDARGRPGDRRALRPVPQPSRSGPPAHPRCARVGPLPGRLLHVEPLLHREPGHPRLHHLPRPAPQRRDVDGPLRGPLPRLPSRRQARGRADGRTTPPARSSPARDGRDLSGPARPRLHRLPHAPRRDPDGPHQVHRSLYSRPSQYLAVAWDHAGRTRAGPRRAATWRARSHPSRREKIPRAGDSPPHRRPRRDGNPGVDRVVADLPLALIEEERATSGLELPLCEHAPGRRLRGGCGLHPLPFGDRRDLPPAPDGPLARPDRSGDWPPRSVGSCSRPTGSSTRSTVGIKSLPPGDTPGFRRPNLVAERGRGAVRARLREPGNEPPGRARRIPLPVADQLVLSRAAVGPLPGLPEG